MDKHNLNSASNTDKKIPRRKKSAVSYRSSDTSVRKRKPTPAKQSASQSRTTSPSLRDRATDTSAENNRNTVPIKAATSTRSNVKKRPKIRRAPAPQKNFSLFRGCLIPLLIFLLICFLILFFSMKSAFKKIEKYKLDTSKITVHDEDNNVNKYMNIALFGVDSQDNEIHEKGSRTDCIIIASINKRNKDVKLMSVYRDTYVSIDGQYDKVNAAYSYGGPELAISTLNRNLDLDITDFATVNFKALADAVDILGGIPLTIYSEKELKNLNDYIGNMNHINGGDSPKFDTPKDFPMTKTFDGNQAVAYSRIRYMEGGDHARANHQRLVVEGIVKKVKVRPWKITKIINSVLPQCKTSFSSSEMTKLSLALPRYSIVDSQAYPWDSIDEKYNGIYYGFPLTVYSNTVKAHEYLFGTKDYEPSEELGKISDKVKVISDQIQ